MPFQVLRWARIDVHLNIRKRHVDPHNLRKSGCHGLNSNTVVLLLVDHLDAIRHATRRFKVRCIVKQNGAVAYKITSWAKRAAKNASGPCKDLILRGKDRQTFCVPTVDHLVERH